ncbi:MAG: hypothetical protein ABI239_00405, partial [Aquihabitans sp.]
ELLLVAVGVVGLGMKLVGSDDNGDQDPAAIEQDDDIAGFYIPGDLPDGWKMSSLSVFSSPGEMTALGCPCEVTEVGHDGEDSSYLTVTSTDSPPESVGEHVDPKRLNDRSDRYMEDGGIGTVVWRTASGYRAVVSTSLDRTELVDLAEAWTSHEPPVADGYHVITSWSRDQPIETVRSVQWTFTNAETGQDLSVVMGAEAPGYGLLTTSIATLPGNGLPLGMLPDDAGVIGSWPGSAQLLGVSLSDMAGNDDQPMTPADLAAIKAILGSFQPADAATWAEHLATAPVDPTESEPQDLDLVRTDRISDWWEGPESGTDPPQRTVEVIQRDHDDHSAAISVESAVDQLAVTAGEPFAIELTMTNRTGATVEVSGCSFGSVTWSTVDDNGLMTNAGGTDVDCDRGLQPWPDGERRTQTFEFPGLPDEGPIAAVIQYGDNIEQGVTVVVPGQAGG